MNVRGAVVTARHMSLIRHTRIGEYGGYADMAAVVDCERWPPLRLLPLLRVRQHRRAGRTAAFKIGMRSAYIASA